MYGIVILSSISYDLSITHFSKGKVGIAIRCISSDSKRWPISYIYIIIIHNSKIFTSRQIYVHVNLLSCKWISCYITPPECIWVVYSMLDIFTAVTGVGVWWCKVSHKTLNGLQILQANLTVAVYLVGLSSLG